MLKHTPSIVQRADCWEGRALSAGLEKSCTCVYGAGILDAFTLSSLILLFFLLSSSSPLLLNTFGLLFYFLPYLPPLPSSSSLLFWLISVCSDLLCITWTIESAHGTRCYSILGSMSPSGSTKENKTPLVAGDFFIYSYEELNQSLFWPVFTTRHSLFETLELIKLFFQIIAMWTKLCQHSAQIFVLGVMLSVVDSKGTLYGGHINPFYGNRYNLYKAGLNPHYSPNKPTTRHK